MNAVDERATVTKIVDDEEREKEEKIRKLQSEGRRIGKEEGTEK